MVQVDDYTNPDKALHPDNLAHNAKSLNYVRSSTSEGRAHKVEAATSE